MKLDKRLNLVVPVERSDGTTIYVHATPVSREIFDQNFLVMSKAFGAIYNHSLHWAMGPRIAAKMLKKVASELGIGEEVGKGLIAEMNRLSNVVVPNEKGWSLLPLDVAAKSGAIDEDDVDEVENIIAFFILASAVHKRKDAEGILIEAAKLWSAQLTSLNSTAYCASLQTLTKPVTTGAKAPVSSIPS